MLVKEKIRHSILGVRNYIREMVNRDSVPRTLLSLKAEPKGQARKFFGGHVRSKKQRTARRLAHRNRVMNAHNN